MHALLLPQRSQTRSAARHHHARREWDDRSLARRHARSSRRRKTLFEFWEKKEVECSWDSSFLLHFLYCSSKQYMVKNPVKKQPLCHSEPSAQPTVAE